MSIERFIQRMPKVELHVHLEGSIQPETLLALAERNHVTLPARSVAELRNWYVFKDFSHFVEVYLTICDCVRTPADMELITLDFLKGQARQNIRYSELIFTPYSHREHISFEDQWTAIQKAHTWAKTNLGVTMNLAPDISRQIRPIEHSMLVAEWAVKHKDDGIIALGLGGAEIGNPPELFQEAFDYAYTAGLAGAPHAGETEGPASIWGALNTLHAIRIGHGVRCLEDPKLVAYLKERQIPLQVCPSSNVCLGVAPSLAEHPLPKLLEEGLFVTINSDDPPMFNTTLTDEYLRIQQTMGFDLPLIEGLVLNGVRAALLPFAVRQTMESEFKTKFIQLREELDI